jgi:hypothetical protein
MKTRNASLVILMTLFFSKTISAQPGNNKVEVLQPVLHTSYEPVSVLTVNRDNKLRFESADNSVERFLVNASQGSVKQDGKDFIVMPEKTGDLVLSIYNYDDINNPILIEERNMKVVSGPVVSIAGKNGGQISKEDFLKAEKVECSANYTITEFKFSVAGKAVDYKEFFRKGDSLSPEMIATVQQLHSGEKIFIEYILAKPENSEATRQLAPVTFTLTE